MLSKIKFYIRFLSKEIIFWLDSIISYMPGELGCFVRNKWYSIVFKKKSLSNLFIGTACKFIQPKNIYFSENVSIDHHCYFNADGGEIICDEGCAFNSNVHINAAIGGKIHFGENCLVGPGVVLRTANHIYERADIIIKSQGHKINDIIISNDCWIGANAVILGGVTIGQGAVIGAGSVVTKDIEAMSVYAGVPAKYIKRRN